MASPSPSGALAGRLPSSFSPAQLHAMSATEYGVYYRAMVSKLPRDELELAKTQWRRIVNRESAAETRARQQTNVQHLAAPVTALQTENAQLKQKSSSGGGNNMILVDANQCSHLLDVKAALLRENSSGKVITIDANVWSHLLQVREAATPDVLARAGPDYVRQLECEVEQLKEALDNECTTFGSRQQQVDQLQRQLQEAEGAHAKLQAQFDDVCARTQQMAGGVIGEYAKVKAQLDDMSARHDQTIHAMQAKYDAKVKELAALRDVPRRLARERCVAE